MSFHQCIEVIEENMPIDDSDDDNDNENNAILDEYDNDICENDAILTNIEEEYFNEDFDNLQISFHAQSVVYNTSDSETLHNDTITKSYIKQTKIITMANTITT